MAHSPTLVPLFGAIPGGVELLVVGLFFLVIPVGLAVWVGLDAREHSDHPLAWGLTVLVASFSPFFLGALAVTLLYVISKDELGSHAPPTFSESEMSDDTQVLGQPLGAQRTERGAADSTGAESNEDGDDRS